MSKTFKQQPKQPKPVREAAQRYKRERRKEQAKEWKSALEWRLGKGRLNFGYTVYPNHAYWQRVSSKYTSKPHSDICPRFSSVVNLCGSVKPRAVIGASTLASYIPIFLIKDMYV
jgi:hypothetical protein